MAPDLQVLPGGDDPGSHGGAGCPDVGIGGRPQVPFGVDRGADVCEPVGELGPDLPRVLRHPAGEDEAACRHPAGDGPG